MEDQLNSIVRHHVGADMEDQVEGDQGLGLVPAHVRVVAGLAQDPAAVQPAGPEGAAGVVLAADTEIGGGREASHPHVLVARVPRGTMQRRVAGHALVRHLKSDWPVPW